MRLVLINANTSPAITALVVAAARKTAAPTTDIVGVTARFGARYIASRASYAIAGHAALDAYAECATEADAIVLACFGDPGIAALREIATVPVVGMAEAACRAAAAGGRRFAIVTGGSAWGPMLTEYVATLGLAGQLAGVHTVALTGAEIAADPRRGAAVITKLCREIVAQGRTDAIVLGGAGLAGISERSAAELDIPMIDGLRTAVSAAEAAAAAPAPAFAPPDQVSSTGLAPRLEALLAGERQARRFPPRSFETRPSGAPQDEG
jgi:allantoin racemase